MHSGAETAHQSLIGRDGQEHSIDALIDRLHERPHRHPLHIECPIEGRLELTTPQEDPLWAYRYRETGGGEVREPERGRVGAIGPPGMPPRITRESPRQEIGYLRHSDTPGRGPECL